MATVKKAIRTADLPDAELARLLADRYKNAITAGAENIYERLDHLQTPLDEAVRRLKNRPVRRLRATSPQ